VSKKVPLHLNKMDATLCWAWGSRIKHFRWHMWPLSHAHGGHLQCLLWQEVPYIHCDFHVYLHHMWPLSHAHVGHLHCLLWQEVPYIHCDFHVYLHICDLCHMPMWVTCIAYCDRKYHTFTVTSMCTYTYVTSVTCPCGSLQVLVDNCKQCTFTVASTVNTYPISEWCPVTSCSPCIKIWMHKVFLITTINYCNIEHWLWN